MFPYYEIVSHCCENLSHTYEKPSIMVAEPGFHTMVRDGELMP